LQFNAVNSTLNKENMPTLHLRKSIGWSPLRLAFLLIPLVLACFALSPTAQAQLPSPAPDGGYPNNNTAEGDNALASLTTGTDNTANGFNALNSNTTGHNNTATGFNALNSNTTGYLNTAEGSQALFNNTTGFNNTANGNSALFSNTSGAGNTANGAGALQQNSDGFRNTANGFGALLFNDHGTDNTAGGFQALFSNRNGFNNTAYGSEALEGMSRGNNNIALGFQAGQNLGDGDNNIDIGNAGATEASTIRIGTVGTQTKTFIAGISGVDKSSGNPVFIDANGQLGTASASPPGSVVMLPTAGGVAPPAPAGYVFKGFVFLSTKANGGGPTTGYAVYTKS